MLNYGDYNRFSCLYTVCLKATDHLNFKLRKYLVGILPVFRLEFQKFRILEILNFHPWDNDALDSGNTVIVHERDPQCSSC